MSNLLVVSRYKGDISPWIGDFWGKVLVYDKLEGKRLLPNVGREAHTYLHFIITHYDQLPDVTVFFQDDIFEHIEHNKDYKEIVELIRHDTHVDFRSFGFYQGFAEILTFEDYFKYVFFSKTGGPVTSDNWEAKYGNFRLRDCRIDYDESLRKLSLYPTHFYCTFGAIFAVSKQRILARPRNWYRRLMSLVDWHNSPMGAHFMERVWPYVLGEPLPIRLVKIVEGGLL